MLACEECRPRRGLESKISRVSSHVTMHHDIIIKRLCGRLKIHTAPKQASYNHPGHLEIPS